MMRGCFSFIMLVIVGVSVSSMGTRGLGPPPGNRAEQITSPTGRFTAQIWRCCADYAYISGFDVTDHQTGSTTRQALVSVPDLDRLAGAVYFAWTHSEHYLVLTTDNRVTSHGCDEFLVYSGDGSQLVYNSAPTSLCKSLSTDLHIGVAELCANDDILFAGGYRFTPSTAAGVNTGEKTCEAS